MVVLKLKRRQVEVGWRQLATKLAEAALQAKLVAFTPANLGNAVTAIFGAADAIGIKETPGTLAWRLIEGALQRATLELLGTALSDRQAPAGDLAHLENRIALALGEGEVEIDRDFLRRPLVLPVYVPIREKFEALLVRVGLAGPEARMLAHRLDSYFPAALYAEEQAHPERYAPLFRRSKAGRSSMPPGTPGSGTATTARSSGRWTSPFLTRASASPPSMCPCAPGTPPPPNRKCLTVPASPPACGLSRSGSSSTSPSIPSLGSRTRRARATRSASLRAVPAAASRASSSGSRHASPAAR
jgi:hypothetical protein